MPVVTRYCYQFFMTTIGTTSHRKQLHFSALHTRDLHGDRDGGNPWEIHGNGHNCRGNTAGMEFVAAGKRAMVQFLDGSLLISAYVG